MKVFGKGVCMYGVCVMEECREFVYYAYVLQGGGGGDETVETGMKLTRSLQSGSEASLSMGSGNGTTRGSGAEVSAAYMFWLAEDASSAAMDYMECINNNCNHKSNYNHSQRTQWQQIDLYI